MNTSLNENARLSVAALSRAKEDASRTNLQSNLTTFNEGRQDILVMILPHGEQKAISAMELRRKLGLSNKRVLRYMVEKSRTDGAVILSSDSGYFLPSDDPLEAERELRRFLKARDKTLRTNRSATRSARKAYERLKRSLSGQMAITEASNEHEEKSPVSEKAI